MIIASFGSNLSFCGQPPQQIVERAMVAVAELARPGATIIRSSLYETEAWPDPADPPFVNAVMAFDSCDLPPLALLAALQAVEDGFGRSRDYETGEGRRYGPRTLDIDLIAYGDERIETDALTLPHRHLSERPFVLVPLAEVLPVWCHPADGVSARQMLSTLGPATRAVRRLERA